MDKVQPGAQQQDGDLAVHGMSKQKTSCFRLHGEGLRMVRNCLCEANTGVSLGAWVTHNTQLIERKRMQTAAELERAMSPAPGPPPGGCVGDFGQCARLQGP